MTAVKKQPAEELAFQGGPNQSDTIEERREMADGRYYDSARADNQENFEDTWRSLGDLASRLAEKVGGLA